jgi:hypothetical protein
VTVEKLMNHPVVIDMTAYYDRVREEGFIGSEKPEGFNLGVHLRYLLDLDPTAVYHEVGESTIVYYVSPKSRIPGVGRIVLAPDGRHRRIDTVGFDPR